MFYSHCLLSRKGPLGSIWVAAYCFKKLKKAQVTSTDISSSVDTILQEEFDAIAYRVLAYLLLGVVRIYSKKVEYLFDDCNKVLLEVKDFVLHSDDGTLKKTLQAPYFSITLPERFELDAFDLEILEETSGGNVMSREEITLKDSMWKTGGICKYTLNQGCCEELATCQDTRFADYSLNKDDLSHSRDIDMEQDTWNSASTLQASMERLRANMFCRHEYEDLEVFFDIEEDPPHTRKSSVDVYLTDLEHLKVPDKIDLDEPHAEASVQKLCNDNVFHEACLGIEMFSGEEEEPAILAKQYHPLEEQQKEASVVEQSEIEVHGVINDLNMSDIEAAIDKLLENRFFQEERLDINLCSVVVEPPEHAIPFNEEHKNVLESPKFLETTSLGKRKCHVVLEDHPLCIQLDATCQSKANTTSGVNMPDSMVISTPVAKERARILRKRKCLFDDVIAFPNSVIKHCIEDASDLVSKRRKVPHTAIAIWRAWRFSSLHRCFLDPLIPCTSLELRSLFCGTGSQIPKTVEPVGGSIDTEETSTRLECHTAGRSVETVECLEKSNVSGLPVGRLDKTVKLPENVLIQESVGTEESVETIVFECPAIARSLGNVENLDMSEPFSVGGSAEIAEPRDNLNVSVSPTASRFAETLAQPGKLDIGGSPPSSGSLEKMAIAPETPSQCTMSLRSFESPERPDISDTDGLRYESVEKEICPMVDQELGLSLLNEEVNTPEGDMEEHCKNYDGWSERTRVAMKCLHLSFLKQKRTQEEVINLLPLIAGRTRKESAKLFYEILVLKSKGFVDVKQEDFYGDILVRKTSQWEQACGLLGVR